MQHSSAGDENPVQRGLPDGIRGGVHVDLHAPGTTTFVLHAPYKPFVSLVGDFNDWDTRKHRMVTSGDGVWWINVPTPAATRYGYYVAIDEQAHAWVGDPYAQRLAWDAEGPWAYFEPGDGDFNWTDGAWRTPALRDLVIYELCVRDFAGQWADGAQHFGTFDKVRQKLDYLVGLGVNAVELMPIQAFPGRSSWGYNPVFYFAPAQVYGTPADFKALVDACHARGIAVILDVAFNHAWGEQPYYQFFPPMFAPDGSPLQDWNPFFHHTPQAVNGWGGVDWDHFTEITTHHFQQVVRYWLEEYHVDGFRFDWVCGVDYDSSEPMRPGFHPYHGISAICWAARQAKPDAILIGEYWQLPGTHPEKTAAKLVTETEMDAVWRGRFHHTLDDVLNERWEWEKQDIRRAIGGFRDDGYCAASQIVNYTCSHDEVRPEHEIKFYSWPHIQRPKGMTIQQLALRKALLGLIALVTAPGVPMIYAGQEFGDDSARTIDFLPPAWGRLEGPLHRAHFEVVQRLICARRSISALRCDAIQFEDDNFAVDKLVRYRRWSGDGEQVVVALNFDNVDKGVTILLPHGGLWQEIVSGRVEEFVGGITEIRLRAWEGVVYAPYPAMNSR